MPFVTPALFMSIVGDARLVRYIHLPNLNKKFIVWVAEMQGGRDRFLYREPIEIDETNPPQDTVVIDTNPIPQVKNFYMYESEETENEINFLFDDGHDIWYFVYNFETEIIVIQPYPLYKGTRPTMLSDGLLRSVYEKDNNIKIRTNIVDTTELTVVRQTLSEITDYDITRKGELSIGRYTGMHSFNTVNARLFYPVANTEILYNPNREITSNEIEDISGNSLNGTISGIVTTTKDGYIFNSSDSEIDIPVFTLPNALTIEAWVVPMFRENTGYIYESNNMYLRYKNSGKLEFSFEGTGGTVKLIQKSGVRLTAEKRNHIVISHTFGVSSASFIMINGVPVTTDWTEGNGDDSITSTSQVSKISLMLNDSLHSFRLSSNAKTQENIKLYMRGRI